MVCVMLAARCVAGKGVDEGCKMEVDGHELF
jgi:hypothetical protein